MGVELEFVNDPTKRAPFLGENGCIVPPHLRVQCTLHTCDVNGVAMKRNDPNLTWTNEYFRLREEVDIAEFEEERI